jgi:hypothetical protein
MKRKKKSKIYFTQETEDAIIIYNETNDPYLRNKLYEEHIKYPFEKLVENIFNTFKFSYFDVGYEDIKTEVVSNLIEKIHMYKPGKGKAFSYFSIVAKNYLILHNNNNHKSYKKVSILSEMPEGWNVPDDFDERELTSDYKEFNGLMLEWWQEYITDIFTEKRDIQIADSILELFRRSEHIEDFNKKYLYILVREMTGYKTHYITKVVNSMKSYQMKMLDEYLQTGYITLTPTHIVGYDETEVDEEFEEYYD